MKKIKLRKWNQTEKPKVGRITILHDPNNIHWRATFSMMLEKIFPFLQPHDPDKIENWAEISFRNNEINNFLLAVLERGISNLESNIGKKVTMFQIDPVFLARLLASFIKGKKIDLLQAYKDAKNSLSYTNDGKRLENTISDFFFNKENCFALE